LLGKAHYQRYKDIKRQKIEKIKSGVENADQLQDQLTKLEVSYITDNIK
jgi:F0F1-type ATP synthase membrane subunit b/b'